MAAERALLARLDGSCRTPIAALAVLEGTSTMRLDALIATPDGRRVLRTQRVGAASDAAALGDDAGRSCAAMAGPNSRGGVTMRVLVTRPREDAERLAAQLEARGHAIVIEPIFTIEPVRETPLDLDGVQALLLTSANGARAFGMRSRRRDLRVFAVGDATAEAARALGFADVESAGGDVADLVRLARERAQPDHGALLHVAGSAVAGDLAGQLGADGFEVRRAVLYRAEPVGALSGGTVTALRDRHIDVILFFFSPDRPDVC